MTLNSINPLFTMIDALQPTLGAVRYVEVTVQYADGSVVAFSEGKVDECEFKGVEHETPIGGGLATLTCSIPFNEVQ